MEAYERMNIQEVPLSSPFFRKKVERFLESNGLRMEALDLYLTLQDADGEILAGAGLSGDVLKCVAVSKQARSEGLLAPLLSQLIQRHGAASLKVFTKPEYETVFQSLGFKLLARTPLAILMENGRGLEQYCAYLSGLRRPGRAGVIILNANPFTLGHQYLISKALEQVDTLYLIPVREDLSVFPYAERLPMIRAGVPAEVAGRVVVAEGSAYQISAATFPTYFLKDLSEAAETQMRLDIDLYTRHIAPALGNPTRLVGSEPIDALTKRYNVLLQEHTSCIEIPRLGTPDAVSASAVRAALDRGSFREAAALCPESTWPYLLAHLAERALRLELDLPMKPGLVCPDSSGAHTDMDYGTMRKGIAAIRPFFAPMALAASVEALRPLGIEAEKAMLAATGGVNTHRGAIFCLGLALNAWAQGAHNVQLMQSSLGKIAQGIYAKSQNNSNLPPRGAMALALSGYRPLFEDWLPFYHGDTLGPSGLGMTKKTSVIPSEASVSHRLLLKIMSTLDDTCVVKRVGQQRAEEVKKEAGELLKDFSEEKLEKMCERYAAEGISPGGAADMLALTIFIDSII